MVGAAIIHMFENACQFKCHNFRIAVRGARTAPTRDRFLGRAGGPVRIAL